MITLLHIVLAVLSLMTASVAYYKASKRLLVVTVVGTFMTLMSGVIMVVLTPHLATQACVSGAVYLTAIAAASVVTKYKIARLAAATS